MQPRLSLLRISVDDAGFALLGLDLWRHRYGQDSRRKNFRDIPGLVPAYEAGDILSCATDDSGEFAYVLAKKGQLRESASFVRVRNASRAPLALLVKLFLHSDLLAFPRSRAKVSGLSGVLHVYDSHERYLSAIEWDVEELRPGLVSIFPACRTFRRHKEQWLSLDKSGSGVIPLPIKPDAWLSIYRPVEGAEEETINFPVYRAIMGGVAAKYKDGDLVRGASVRDAKEADMPWEYLLDKDALLDRVTRSSLVVAAADSLKSLGAGKVFSVDFAYSEQDKDRRVTKGLRPLREKAWADLYRDVFKGKAVVVLDLRIIDRTKDISGIVASIQGACEFKGIALLDSDGFSLPVNFSADKMAEYLQPWLSTDPATVGWICIVDEPRNIKDELPDTKILAYSLAIPQGRAVQSVQLPKILSIKSKEVRAQSKIMAATDSMAPTIGGSLPDGDSTGFNALAKPKSRTDARVMPPEIRMILADLAIGFEIQAGSLIRSRPWHDSAIPYVFVDEEMLGDAVVFIALYLDADGRIFFIRSRAAHEIRKFARGRKIMGWSPDLMTLYFPDGVYLRATGVRAMMPGGRGKSGWIDLMGVCRYDEVMGYTSDGLDNPNGDIEKGLVLRVVDRGDLDDLGRVTNMCLDPTVRLNQATVLPAPFKLLREVAQYRPAKAAVDDLDGF